MLCWAFAFLVLAFISRVAGVPTVAVLFVFLSVLSIALSALEHIHERR